MFKHLNIRIFGNVQGVFFRHSAKIKADELGLKGFAQNEEGGSVFIEIEGEEQNLDEFLNWCHKGTEGARVDEVEVVEGSVKHFTDFSII